MEKILKEITIKILLIDDDTEFLNLLETYLLSKGLDIVKAQSGEEGIKAIMKYPEIRLMVTDYQMEGMDGIEMIKTAYRHRNNFHFILMSGYAEQDTVIDALQLSASDFLIKPFKLNKLFKVVRRNLREIATEIQLKLAEKKLVQKKEFLDQIIHSMHNALYVTDPDQIIIYCNSAALDLLKFQENELLRQPVSTIMPDEDLFLRELKKNWKSGKKGIYDLPRELITSKKEKIPVKISHSPLFQNDEFSGILSVATDLTAERKISTLQSDIDYITQILQKISNPTLLLDHKLDVKFVNESYCDFFKISETELLEIQSYEGFSFIWETPEIQELLNSVIHRGRSFTQHEIKFKLAGHPKVMQLSSSSLKIEQRGAEFVLLTFNDITQRVEAEKSLHLLQAGIEQAPDPVAITDSNGIIEYVNPAFEEISGYSKNELMGQNPRLLKSDRHDPSFYKELWSTITRGEKFYSEITNRNKKGDIYIEQVIISPIFDKYSHQITHFIKIARDITDQKQQTAIKHGRLVYLGQTAAGIAHEINNPNTFIRGEAQTLEFYWNYFKPILETHLKGHPGEKVGRKDFSFLVEDFPLLLEHIVEGSTRIKDIVDSIKTFGQQGSLFSRQNLVEIIKKAHLICKSKLKGIKFFEISTDESIGKTALIFGDAGQLIQVLVNILNNGVDSLLSTGTVDSRLLLQLAVKGENYLIKISDNGPGIRQDALPYIFDPFFTTKGSNEGLGLGLNICFNIIQNHKGTLEAFNAPESGAVFEVTFPKI